MNEDKNIEEEQYLNIIKDILSNGDLRDNRTDTKVLGKFGYQMKYNLRNNIIPLLTTKKVFWRAIVEELLWMISGKSNSNILKEKGIHIWDENSSREYLDKIGLKHYEEGDVGPYYGFQWRNYGAKYVNMNTDYNDQGIDQLQKVIDTIKNNPNDRRIILCAWNPSDLSKMALPPCFMEGVIVKTKRGFVDIEKVKIKDELLTHNENYQPINKIFITNYTGKIFLINIYGCHDIIKTTPNHPMYYRKLQNNIYLNPEWINMENITNEGLIGISINNCSHIQIFYENEKEKLLDNLDIWFGLGYFVSHGFIKNNKKGEKKIYFPYCNKILQEQFNKIIQEFSLVKTKNITDKGKWWCELYKVENIFWKKLLLNFLDENYQVNIIPIWIHNAPILCIKNFLKGFLAATGYLKSEPFFQTLAPLLIGLDLQKLFLKADIIISIHLNKDRKRTQIEKLMNKNFNYIITSKKPNKSKCFIENGFGWFKVKTITSINVENKKVYNFEVNEDHTYTVNNFATHNCHVMSQFYVNNGELSCMMTQRSADIGLGVPFNIASYSLLTHMIAHICGLKTGEFIHNLGDTHIYENHINQLKEQIKRKPYQFPKLRIKRNISSINDFKYEDFELIDYNYHNKIPMIMST